MYTRSLLLISWWHLALQEHVAGLESQVAELQAQLQALEMEKAHDQAQLAALAEFGGTCCLASPTKPLASQQQQQQQQQQPDHIRYWEGARF